MTNLSAKGFQVNPALQKHFGYCLYKAAMRMRGMMDDELEPFGLVAPQFGILNLLEHAGPLSQMDLGLQMNIDKTTVVKLIDGLEKYKFVTRVVDPVDRRIKRVAITKHGKAVLVKLLPLRSLVEKRFLAPLTQKERDVLATAMPKLLR